MAQAGERFVSYDPNVRPAFVEDPAATWHDLAEVAARARLVKCSEEDLAALRPGEDEDALAQELLKGDKTELVVVTKGGSGATGYARDRRVDVLAPRDHRGRHRGRGRLVHGGAARDHRRLGSAPARRRLARGAGGRPVALLLSGAALAASVTCSRRGANPPTRQELPPTWPAD